MNAYTHIILDEVHEREIDMDLLLILVREFLCHNSADTKIILMSATSSTADFIKYFTFHYDDGSVAPAFIKHTHERIYKIEKLYLEDLARFINPETAVNYMTPGISLNMFELAKTIIKLRLLESKLSILVFLPGIYEIESLYAILSQDEQLMESSLICILHSSLPTMTQKIAFNPASKPKVVLSTNIAESSVTITDPEVGCVIDFCLTKYLITNVKSTMSSLQLDWAARSNLEQRAGRTGRLCDGVVYRLISSRFYEKMRKYAIPEMERCPLETVILRIKMLDIMPPTVLLDKALNPPDPDIVINAIMTLKELGGLQRLENGFFQSQDGKLTYVGRIMAGLPLDVRITKFIIVGYMFSVFDEAIVIGAGLNGKSIFRNNFNRKFDDYSQKLCWTDSSSCDFIAILNAYKLWQYMTEQGHFTNLENEKRWCDQYNLERKNLHEMRVLIREIQNRLEELNMINLCGSRATTWQDKEKALIIKICAAGAFMPNYFITGQSSEFLEQDIHKQLGGKNPLNSIYFKNMKKEYVGEVYEEQLRQKLVDVGICRNTKDVKVTIDKGSTKIFVEFVDGSSEIDNEIYDAVNVGDQYRSRSTSVISGKVAPEVFKAVRLRKLGVKFSLQVMSSEESEAYALQHGIGNTDKGYFEINKFYYKEPSLVVQPLTCVAWVEGTITHIDHCGKFYIQPSTDENRMKLQEIRRGLLAMPIKYQNIEQLKEGNLVIADDGKIKMRAKIIEISNDDTTVKCYLIDYGNTQWIQFGNIYAITKMTRKIFDIPERCFQASLCKIAPSFIKCPRGKWTCESVEVFRSIALHKVCKVDVFSVVDDIASVNLIVDGQYVNEMLITAGFAQACEENFPSKMDHEIRKKNQHASDGQFGAATEFQQKVYKLMVPRIKSPNVSHCSQTLTLNGPLSPMETSVSHILVHSSSSEITIDSLSVNSVVLYDDPGNLYGRFLIAANVTKNNRETVLHETSKMPDIPGLPVLLALIFAPEVIFRRNAEKTRFDNIRFGLGFHTSKASPFFREHDCELPVHFELMDDDFTDINFLRSQMSWLLETPTADLMSTHDGETKFSLLSHVQVTIMKILNRKRAPLAVPFLNNSYTNWNKDDQSKDSITFSHSFPEDGGLYHKISQPLLKPIEDKKKAEMISDLEKLQQEIQ